MNLVIKLIKHIVEAQNKSLKKTMIIKLREELYYKYIYWIFLNT